MKLWLFTTLTVWGFLGVFTAGLAVVTNPLEDRALVPTRCQSFAKSPEKQDGVRFWILGIPKTR
jgi:hypothetical protein